MIKYHSTRNKQKFYTFEEVLLKGFAPDGGLFVPSKIPHITPDLLKSLVGKTYQEVAYSVIDLFELGISDKFLKNIIKIAYSDNFDTEKITPLVRLQDNQYLLELWHGPTASFKDIALQLMARLFSRSLQKSRRYLFLVATSGDTGKAALEGFKNRKNIYIIVFYPKNRISKLQELSMVTQEGKNLAVIAVNGNFDDTQRVVKEIFNDREFNQKLKENYQIFLSSANSINWGRLLPQIVYHIYGYLELVSQKVISYGDLIDVAVPTGNAGNILAAFYAQKLGLPVRKLICAANANNAVSRFLKTGIYDGGMPMVKTPSPAMDILIAGNIERLLFEITGNPDTVEKWMTDMREKKIFRIDKKTLAKLALIFNSGWVSNRKTLQKIKNTYDKTGYLMDPHTAVAVEVVKRYKEINSDNIPVIIVLTAHWSKFASSVYQAIKPSVIPSESRRTSGEVEGSRADTRYDEFALLDEILKIAPAQKIPASVALLKNGKIRHRDVSPSDKNKVEKVILNILNRIKIT